VISVGEIRPNSTTIAGTLNSTPNTIFAVEVFSSPACDTSGFGEGRTFLGSVSVTTDAAGNAPFVAAVGSSSAGLAVTATATDPDGNTSEFSRCRTIRQPPHARPGVVTGSTTWSLRSSLTTGAATTTFAYGTRPLVPLVGDWDGDGVATAGTFEGGTFRLRNANSTGNPDITFSFGDSRGFPVAGDFDGDGTDDVAVFRNGVWQVRHLGTGVPPDATFSFGPALSWPSVVPVAGDWNGDGIDGIGLYNLMSGTAGEWSLRQTASGGSPTQTVTYGGAGLYPIVGDWNGDGTDSLGTKVMAGTGWELSDSNTAPSTTTSFDFGASNDLPYAWR
jgi:hypothetical protein